MTLLRPGTHLLGDTSAASWAARLPPLAGRRWPRPVLAASRACSRAFAWLGAGAWVSGRTWPLAVVPMSAASGTGAVRSRAFVAVS